MQAVIAIILFWLIAGATGHLMMSRLIAGLPSQSAVSVVAIAWGLLMAVLARWLIVGLDVRLLARLATYFVGMVNAGSAMHIANAPQDRALDDMLMSIEYSHFKREVFTYLPRVVFVIASVILLFLWK